MLTSLPPGKVRFTIFDPTGLGENFSAFMHLSDYDERLVTNRIWTEAPHIQQRLTDLTEHMENVIQKYLRNEFASIQEYNTKAGEIAEPFQVLVVANFPVNFSEESARRLVSIASSGARCGVYFLLSVDRRQKLPGQFDLEDLKSAANSLTWQDNRFAWDYDDLRQFPCELEKPTSPELTGQIVRAVGRLAKDANRVEVPFQSVAPARSAWWKEDSRQQLEVALGRAGATQLQYLTLGHGTSQHVLVAGKTGSGKSTLLNAIITNLSLCYSPEQLQFYLVDFKKGVEFKAYAELGLPHAAVIAIESEREFGLSVLERLDAELHVRGEKFRSCGAQGLAAYREALPAETMPRLLLIVDEFQEFFVKDDKISQEAGLLLDRLVRQGRAFGIHVLLGSQTLAGAYTLARSTLGQMAVRIALQCSESDAHLILSEENTAARLLNRPGEAIYNNANGLFEGNHPFQVVWLPDSQRESYLRQLAEHARSQSVPFSPAIVFEETCRPIRRTIWS
jgi:DNA segregation ATPase FtsK/SpoIIIE-like protein